MSATDRLMRQPKADVSSVVLPAAGPDADGGYRTV
jgi:hypothetical protein